MCETLRRLFFDMERGEGKWTIGNPPWTRLSPPQARWNMLIFSIISDNSAKKLGMNWPKKGIKNKNRPA
jgi:hypothetical protein